MSRALEEIKQIRRDIENLENIVKSYQKKGEHLREREMELVKKMESMEGRYNWREFLQEPDKPEDCVLYETMYVMPEGIETPEMRMKTITKLREEIVQKQFENLQLEKELESRRMEHRRFHEVLSQRRMGLLKEEPENLFMQNEMENMGDDGPSDAMLLDDQPLKRFWWF